MPNEKKMAFIAVGLGVTIALSGIAFAFYTTSGSGTGTGTAGTGTVLALHGSVTNALLPGASSPVTFTVDNSSPGNQQLGTIHLNSVTVDGGHASCVVADFTMPDVVANQSIPNANGVAVTAQGTLSMANTAVSQDACKGATLTLNLTS